jgi:hypothetical protein
VAAEAHSLSDSPQQVFGAEAELLALQFARAKRARRTEEKMHLSLKLRRRLAIVGLAVLTAVVVVVAAPGESGQKLYLGMNLHFTGPDSTAGTWIASGAVEDSGTVAVQHLALVPIGQSGMARLSGEETFTSPLGSIVTRFDGKAFPLTGPHQVGKGQFEIESGTGAYAGIRGNGSFLIVVDAISNELIGTEEGNVQR